MLNKNLLSNFFYIPSNKPAKKRTWYYQHEGEEKQQLIKEGKYWYYNSPIKNGGGEIGCDTLDGAKGDLKYYGSKVWSELQQLNNN